MRRRAQLLGLAVLAGVAVIVTGVVAGGSPAAPRHRGAPESVTTSSDPGKAKLDDALRQKVDAGQTAQVPVFVTATGDLAQVRALLADDHCVNEITTPTHCTRTINATHAGQPPFDQSADGAAPPTLPPA